jgi:hypothetical protein
MRRNVTNGGALTGLTPAGTQTQPNLSGYPAANVPISSQYPQTMVSYNNSITRDALSYLMANQMFYGQAIPGASAGVSNSGMGCAFPQSSPYQFHEQPLQQHPNQHVLPQLHQLPPHPFQQNPTQNVPPRVPSRNSSRHVPRVWNGTEYVPAQVLHQVSIAKGRIQADAIGAQDSVEQQKPFDFHPPHPPPNRQMLQQTPFDFHPPHSNGELRSVPEMNKVPAGYTLQDLEPRPMKQMQQTNGSNSPHNSNGLNWLP